MGKLKELCELIVDCEHKTAITQDEGYPSIRTPNVGKGRLLLEGVNRVSEETYLLWTQREAPRPGDLILAREAPIGNVALIPPDLKVCLGQRTVLIRPDRNKINPQYLTYLLLGDEIQGRILGECEPGKDLVAFEVCPAETKIGIVERIDGSVRLKITIIDAYRPVPAFL